MPVPDSLVTGGGPGTGLATGHCSAERGVRAADISSVDS